MFIYENGYKLSNMLQTEIFLRSPFFWDRKCPSANSFNNNLT